MTKQQAIRLARAKWGKAAGVSYNPRASSAKGREYARERRAALGEEPQCPPLCPECAAKRAAYRQERDHWRKQRDKWWSKSLQHQYQIFADVGPFREIKGQGDSWQEAAEKAKLL